MSVQVRVQLASAIIAQKTRGGEAHSALPPEEAGANAHAESAPQLDRLGRFQAKLAGGLVEGDRLHRIQLGTQGRAPHFRASQMQDHP